MKTSVLIRYSAETKLFWATLLDEAGFACVSTSGYSEAEAVGSLMLNYPNATGVKIEIIR